MSNTDTSCTFVDGWAVLRVSGEIDALTAPELRQNIAEQLESTDALVIDLSAVTFMDSSGLSVLVQALKWIQTAQGRLKLVVNTPQVLKVLQLTQLEQVFDISVTLQTATVAPPTTDE